MESARTTAGPTTAFTLLECVLTLAILVVMAAVAVPRFGQAAQQSRVELVVERLQRDIEQAQRAARTTGASLTITFDPAADRYRVVGLPGLSRRSDDYEVRLDQAPYRADLIGADFGDQPILTFDGWGRPHCGGQIVVAVGDRRVTLQVRSTTGAVEVP